MRIIVYHAALGCETGCCGHVVEMDDGAEEFVSSHPYTDDDDPRSFAEQCVRDAFGDEHVADLDWENCVISYD